MNQTMLVQALQTGVKSGVGIPLLVMLLLAMVVIPLPPFDPTPP